MRSENMRGNCNAGLIGLGTVGKSVVRLWPRMAGVILKRIADIDRDRAKGIKLKKGVFTTKPEDILNDPKIRIVIELIGGTDHAYRYITTAIDKGKNVVTANKALLALRGEELFERANSKGVSIGYEASVCAGVPIIRAIREGLAVTKIKSIYGIINGTSNFILSSMEEGKISFNRALLQAQKQGFAEADASLDIDGYDSQHKLAILSRLSFRTKLKLSDIYVEGIRRITNYDIIYAKEFGYSIRLLAIAKEENNSLEARVHPTLIPESNILSSVAGIYNACFVEGDACGRMIFYGEGAGGLPTAGAALSDVLEIASNMDNKKPLLALPAIADTRYIPVKNMDEIVSPYYIRFSVEDKPGVLAKISGILARYGISIASVMQKERARTDVQTTGMPTTGMPVVMMTHDAKESNMARAISSIDRLNVVKEKSLVIRVEEFKD